MCGRFSVFNISESLAQPPGLPAAQLPAGLPGPRYNIAPTQPIAVYVPQEVFQAASAGVANLGASSSASSDGVAQLLPLRWGLIPHWKKDDSGPVLFNARAETVTEKPSFRDAFKQGRCLIPCDGYYEWHNNRPHWISGPTRMWFAGLCTPSSATIITTAAVGAPAQLHHRIPRILTGDELAAWVGDIDAAKDLLEPKDPWPDSWEIREVSKSVNSVANEGAELLLPVEETQPTEQQLF